MALPEDMVCSTSQFLHFYLLLEPSPFVLLNGCMVMSLWYLISVVLYMTMLITLCFFNLFFCRAPTIPFSYFLIGLYILVEISLCIHDMSPFKIEALIPLTHPFFFCIAHELSQSKGLVLRRPVSGQEALLLWGKIYGLFP